LKDVLIGNTNLSLQLGLGYDFSVGKNKTGIINLELRSGLGLTDLIGVEPNGFGFSEDLNRSTSFSFRVGILLPVKNMPASSK